MEMEKEKLDQNQIKVLVPIDQLNKQSQQKQDKEQVKVISLQPLKSQIKEFKDILKIISFGTPLRAAIEKIVRARTGGLIVVANEDVLKIIRGGFYIDCKFTANRAAELSKMDGALILNNKMSRILYAGTLLVPNPDIKTNETGSRHQAAERTAKQTNQLAIAISQRTGIATVYYNNIKYQLKNLEDLLAITRENLKNLEKHRKILDELINKFNILEINDLCEVYDVLLVLQRIEMISRIEKEIKKYLIELGREAGFLDMEFKELTKDIEKEFMAIIKDYKNKISSGRIRKSFSEMSYDSLLDLKNLASIMGYSNLNSKVVGGAYRFLSRVDYLSQRELDALTKKFKLKELLNAKEETLIKSKAIKQEKVQQLLKDINKNKEDLINKI